MIFAIGIVILVLFTLLIRFLKNRYQAVNKVYTYLANLLFFNLIIRTILESYMQDVISSMLNVTDLAWDNKIGIFSSVLAILLFIGILLFPFLCLFLLQYRFSTLTEGHSINRFGSLYGELRTDSRAALLYNVFYMLRRIIFAISAQMMGGYSFAQIQCFIMVSALLLIYFLFIKPFVLPIMNNLEVFNEICILIASYHLIVFTNYVNDIDLQYQAGWSIVGITTVNILVNMFIMVKSSFRRLRLSFRKYRYKFRVWRIQKARKSQYVAANNESQISFPVDRLRAFSNDNPLLKSDDENSPNRNGPNSPNLVVEDIEDKPVAPMIPEQQKTRKKKKKKRVTIQQQVSVAQKQSDVPTNIFTIPAKRELQGREHVFLPKWQTDIPREQQQNEEYKNAPSYEAVKNWYSAQMNEFSFSQKDTNYPQ